MIPERHASILRQRAERIAVRRESSVTAPGREYLRVRIGGRILAVDTLWVREVARPQEILEVPGAPAAVEGVLNLRGRLVAVLALPSFPVPLGEPGTAPLTVIVSDGSRWAAFRVEAVEGMMSFASAEIGSLLGSTLAGIKGVAPGGELVLDVARLFDPAGPA